MPRARQPPAGPPALADLLDEAVASLVHRVRRRTPTWWSAASRCPGWTRADIVAHLVAQCADAEHGLRRVPPRRPAAPARDEVLADQLAVCGRDLAATLRDCPAGARLPDGERADRLGVRLLAEVLLHGWDVDGTPPGDDLAAVVLDRLLPRASAAVRGDDPAGAGEALLVLTGRGGEPRPWSWEPDPDPN